MQSILERIVRGDAVTIGTIGVHSKKFFVSPPLTQHSFDSTEGDDARVLNDSTSAVNPDCIALSNDERSLAYTTSSAIKLLDLQTGRELRTLVGHNGRVNNVVQSNRSIYIWASSASDCTVFLWDTRQHPANVQVRHFDRPVNCSRFSPNDAFLALGSDHLYMMDPRVRHIRSLSSSSQVLNVCFHPSEYLLATASEDRLVRFWDIDTEECVSQSVPADGTLREIAFHNDGSSLLTLTDFKCSAITWEPFEMLGQCALPQNDYSVSLAASVSDVYVLGRSVTSSSVTLLCAPYAKFLIQDEDLLESAKSDEKSEDSVEGSDPAESETFVKNYNEKQKAFTPTYTLPRTPPPQPIKLSPQDEKFEVTMATRSTLTARPKTLRTNRSERIPKPKKVICGTVPRPSHASGVNRRSSQHAETPQKLKVTSSVPDVRNATRKQEIKVRQRQDGNEKSHDTEAPSEPITIEGIINGLELLEQLLERRRALLEKVTQYWKMRGSEGAVTETARMGDTVALTELLDALSQTPAAWNLSLCASVLPHIEVLLTRKDDDCIEVALSALRIVITGCGEVIRSGSQHRSHIGVDVPAEERYTKCTRCTQQLTNMRVKASLFTDHMNQRQAREFNALMQIFDNTIST